MQFDVLYGLSTRRPCRRFASWDYRAKLDEGAHLPPYSRR